MQKADFFGTFLDTVSPSRLRESPLSSIAQSQKAPLRSPLIPDSSVAAGAVAGAVAGAAAGALVGTEGTNLRPADVSPLDAVFKELLERGTKGQTAVDLKSLMPLVDNSLGGLLAILQQLQKFGLVELTPDNMIQVTKQALNLYFTE